MLPLVWAMPGSRPRTTGCRIPSSQDCVEKLLWAQQEVGVEYIGFTIYSLPADVQARIDYLQMIAEEIMAEVATA